MYVDNTDSQLATLEVMKDLMTKSDSFTRISVTETGSIHCQHKKSKIDCQVIIRNELPVGNSELVKFYLTLDEKLKPLMLLIKFWVDCCDLRHENGFSSHAIYLMVLFYLQQDPYKLPSVMDLQKELPPDEIDGWNCAFGPVEFTNVTLESATLFDLLVGFFKFYCNFDYTSKVISPYLGSTIDKVSFVKPYDLPECFEDYLNQEEVFVVNSGFCVQDVFEHSKNVSFSADLSTAGRFTAACRNSLQLLRTDTKDVLYKLLFSSDSLNEFCVKNEGFCDVDTVKSVVLTILREVCGCKVEVKDGDTSVLYSCQSRVNIWDNRIDVLKKLMTELSPDATRIEREVAVTSHIVNNSSESATWKMMVSLNFDTNSSSVNVSFVEVENVMSISHIQHFVYVNLVEGLNDKSGVSNFKVEDDEVVAVKMEKTVDLTQESVKSEDLSVTISDTQEDLVLVETQIESSEEDPSSGDQTKTDNLASVESENVSSGDNETAETEPREDPVVENSVSEETSNVDESKNLTTVDDVEGFADIEMKVETDVNLQERVNDEDAEIIIVSDDVEMISVDTEQSDIVSDEDAVSEVEDDHQHAKDLSQAENLTEVSHDISTTLEENSACVDTKDSPFITDLNDIANSTASGPEMETFDESVQHLVNWGTEDSDFGKLLKNQQLLFSVHDLYIVGLAMKI